MAKCSPPPTLSLSKYAPLIHIMKVCGFSRITLTPYCSETELKIVGVSCAVGPSKQSVLPHWFWWEESKEYHWRIRSWSHWYARWWNCEIYRTLFFVFFFTLWLFHHHRFFNIFLCQRWKLWQTMWRVWRGPKPLSVDWQWFQFLAISTGKSLCPTLVFTFGFGIWPFFFARNCEIKSMAPYGAFVEIAPGREGLCHVSELSAEWLAKPEDVSVTHWSITFFFI